MMSVGVRAIEFVGGPYCGSIAKMTIDVDVIALPDCIAGESVEYLYQSTERISRRQNAIVEYRGKRVVGGSCESGRSKAGE